MITVAIVTPVYERLELLRQALNSVRRQHTSSNIVDIVVDDGSHANVQAYIDDYKKKYKIDWIRYLRRERAQNDLRTSSNAINLGLDACIERSPDVFTRGEASDLRAVLCLHSDDLLSSNSINWRVNKLGNGLVYADWALFAKTLFGKNRIFKIKRADFGSNPQNILNSYGKGFSYPTVIWDIGFLNLVRDYVRSNYGHDGIFSPSITQCEDKDAILSSAEAAVKHNATVSYAPFVSIFYREHPISITGSGSREEELYYNSVVSKKHFGIDNVLPTDLASKLKADLPWSLLTFLPERIRSYFRPLRNTVKSFLIDDKGLPELSRDLEECLKL